MRVKLAASQSANASTNAASERLRSARSVSQKANPVSVSNSVSVMKYAYGSEEGRPQSDQDRAHSACRRGNSSRSARYQP